MVLRWQFTSRNWVSVRANVRVASAARRSSRSTSYSTVALQEFQEGIANWLVYGLEEHYIGSASGSYWTIASKARDCLGFLHHGSRLLGWWSIDEGSREELARLYFAETSGYSTFAPDTVRKMPKKDLIDEVWNLQAALSAQTEITKHSRHEYERLQNDKILCRICFDEQISVVLLPCRHHVLCRTCGEKCKKCPICRVFIEERLPIYHV